MEVPSLCSFAEQHSVWSTTSKDIHVVGVRHYSSPGRCRRSHSLYFTPFSAASTIGTPRFRRRMRLNGCCPEENFTPYSPDLRNGTCFGVRRQSCLGLASTHWTGIMIVSGTKTDIMENLTHPARVLTWNTGVDIYALIELLAVIINYE